MDHIKIEYDQKKAFMQKIFFLNKPTLFLELMEEAGRIEFVYSYNLDQQIKTPGHNKSKPNKNKGKRL